MNKAILIGRLTKDVEIKLTSNQTKFCQFTLAVDRRFKDQNGNRQADFINCIAWRQTAEFIAKYFKKGSRIGVVGSIQTRSYEKDGHKEFVTEVIVDEAEFVESTNKADDTGKKESAAPVEVEPNSGELVADGGQLPFEI